jgi:tRNA-Thr(GGU) m(6)t(6)A37 methyltransferase TsaA
VVTDRHRGHLTILAIPQRAVTFLIDISYVADDLVLRPIGRVESPLTDLAAAPCQGDEGAPECWLVFGPGVRKALEGLQVGDDIVVITWLHLADRNVKQVHPRGDPDRPLQGVFATRSPDRPNPLGMHVVKILAIDGLRWLVRDMEAVDKTPIVDIKPVLEPRGDR